MSPRTARMITLWHRPVTRDTSHGHVSDPCQDRKCTSNEHCCQGTTCIDIKDEGELGSRLQMIRFTLFVKGAGHCLPIYGRKTGEDCKYDSDCELGSQCEEARCQSPLPGSGGYGDMCGHSSDCDVHHGLCCRLTRRQGSQPRKVYHGHNRNSSFLFGS